MTKSDQTNFYGFFAGQDEYPSFIVLCTQDEVNAIEIEARQDGLRGCFNQIRGYKSVDEMKSHAEIVRSSLGNELAKRGITSLLQEVKEES
jgi:hypothetical protein